VLKAVYRAVHFWNQTYADEVILKKRWGNPELLQERVHPNVDGYRAESNAIISWSVGADEAEPAKGWKVDPNPGLFPKITGSIDDLLTAPLPMSSDVGLDLQGGTFTGDSDLRAGQNVTLTVSNGAPDSIATISVHSRARVLGRVLLDGHGNGSEKVRLPRDLEPGKHRLEGTGFDAQDNPVLAARHVDVARAYPVWGLPLVALALILLVLAWIFLRRAYRARPSGPDTPDATDTSSSIT
jgi:hypothetical protein